MFDLQGFLPYLINRAGARLALNFDREIKTHGIVVQEWRVLAALVAHGSQRLSDLAALTSIDLSTLSRLIGRMVRSGLVARGRTNGDRREVVVSLTAKGTRTTQAIIPIARRYERVALRSLSRAEERALKRLLVRVYSNLDTL
jgi:DNA-binding MarR family transcriptional regulator